VSDCGKSTPHLKGHEVALRGEEVGGESHARSDRNLSAPE
jgi:hypothetical protein